MAARAAPVLTVDNLSTHLFNRDGVVQAVDGVSTDVGPGEVLGVVGDPNYVVGDEQTSFAVITVPGRNPRALPDRAGRWPASDHRKIFTGARPGGGPARSRSRRVTSANTGDAGRERSA